MSLADAVSGALRALREDPSDRASLARLIVDLWRWGGFSSSRSSERVCHVVFRLAGTMTRKDRRRGVAHPWGDEAHQRRRVLRGLRRRDEGYWWTVMDGTPWKEPGPWIMATDDAFQRAMHSDNYSKRFASGSELAEYVAARAIEWRVASGEPLKWEILSDPSAIPPPPCPATLGPTRTPCVLLEGHEGWHQWA